MITVEKNLNKNTLSVKLNGSFDEYVDLFKLIGEPPVNGELNVDCEGVKRQNSTGVKNWIKYFQYVHSKGTVVKFYKCSSAIVDQFNLVSNFGGGGIVESLYVPYSCIQCEDEVMVLFNSSQLRDIRFNLPSTKCAKCGSHVSFDDVVDEYFSFLIKE